jgi:hypothetical protein
MITELRLGLSRLRRLEPPRLVMRYGLERYEDLVPLAIRTWAESSMAIDGGAWKGWAWNTSMWTSTITAGFFVRAVEW